MICDRNYLYDRLIDIKSNGFVVPGDTDAFEFALCMLDFIGDTNPELRDDLIYETFYNWIIKSKVFLEKQLRTLVEIAIDEEHLFYKIGEKGTDSVFTRSFSVLVAGLIIYNFRINDCFEEDELKDINKKIMEYMIEEKDVRGYVNYKGWAHTAAHTADVVDELAQYSKINHDDLLEMLRLIKNKVCINDYVYINQEDERLTTAVCSIINRNIVSEAEIMSWIDSFREIERIDKYPEDMNLLVNIKTFLRSLYFRILNRKGFKPVKQAIAKTLKSMSDF